MGIFGILIIAAAYWGITFLKGLDILSNTDTYYARYQQSNGIEVSSPVLVRGIKVGAVTSVSIGSVEEPVTVTMKVRSKYAIPSNSVATIASESLLGGKAIVMQIGDSAEILNDGDTIKGAVDNGIAEQIEDVKGKLTGALDQLTITLEGLNKVLSDDNIASVSSTLGNINRASRNADLAISDLRVKLDGITSDLSVLTAELNRTAPQLGRTIDNLSYISDTLGVSLPELMSSINNTVREVNGTVAAMTDPNGTIGKLLTDSGIYDNLDKSSASLNALLVDLKENPKRYVHISVFGRSDKQRKPKTE